MKKMNKNNRGKWLLGGLILIVLVGLLLFGNSFSISGSDSFDKNKLDGMVLEGADGELLTFNINNNFQQFAIYTSTDNALPLQEVTVDIATTFPPFGDLTSAKFILYDDDWNVKNTWDFLSEVKSAFNCGYFGAVCVNTGSSLRFDGALSFNAPYVPGDYRIGYKIVGKVPDGGTYLTLAQENRVFSVMQSKCPDNEGTDYLFLQSISHGDWYKKTVTQYGSFPGCDVTTYESYKTVCDDGYLALGSTTNIQGNAVDCVKDVELVTCYDCNGETLVSDVFDDECPNGWSESKIVCEPVVTPVTCYSCEDYERVSSVFDDECDVGWSLDKPDCSMPSITCFACNVNTGVVVSFVQEGSVCPDNSFEDSSDVVCGTNSDDDTTGAGGTGEVVVDGPACDSLSISDRALSFEKPCGLGLYSVGFIGLFILLLVGIILRGKKR